MAVTRRLFVGAGTVTAASYLLGLERATAARKRKHAFARAGVAQGVGTVGITLTRSHYLPPVSEWPDATNTGVPAGTSLTPSGTVETSSISQVVQDLDITGAVVVSHNNVIVRRCRISWAGEVGGVLVATGRTGVTVEDCELIGTSGTAIFYEGNGTTIRRLNINGGENGFHVGGNNLDVRDCWIHNLDPPGVDPHTDGLECSPGTGGLTLDHNNWELDTGGLISGGIQMETGALPTAQNFDWLVNNNRVILTDVGDSRGAVTIRLPREDVSGSNTRFTNNRLMPGEFGAVAFQGVGGAITEWSGNVRDDTGAAINLP